MGIKFAAQSGNYNSPSTWDNGVSPVDGDFVFPNGFNVTINVSIAPNTLSAAQPTVSVVNISTPAMTSNSSPSGTASASSNSPNAFNAFSQNAYLSSWVSTVANSGILQYQFPAGKIIRRYCLKGLTANPNPRNWTFEGSLDGTTWVILETVTAYTMGLNGHYISGLITNTVAYPYYRINVTAVQVSGGFPNISELEMTESTSVNTGVNTAGSFLVSSGGIAINSTTLTQLLTNTLITFSHASGTSSLTNVTDINGISASSTTPIISDTAVGTTNITAPNFRSSGLVIGHAATGPLNIFGSALTVLSGSNVISSTGSGTVTMVGSVNSGVNIPTISKTVGNFSLTGNVTGGLGSGISFTSSGTLTVVGTVQGGANSGITASAGTVNITGNAIAGAISAIVIAGATAVNLTGTATASPTANSISGTGAGAVTLIGNAINNASLIAIYNPRVFISSASTSQWTFNTPTPSVRILYSADSLPGTPIVGDVRDGVTYGGSLVGTLIVPSPNNVTFGTPTDNTTGLYSATPSLIATEIFTKLLSSATDFSTSGSFGKLIKDNLDVTVSSRLASASYVAPNNADVTAIKAKTDNLPSDPASEATVASKASQTSVNNIKINTDLIPAVV